MKIQVPLFKVDEARRLITGIATSETPDHSDEIMDYALSKPNFLKWSQLIEKNSGGKSKGNLRAMHSNLAAGKIRDLRFDDSNKLITITAEVVDDQEWKKVMKGVYTGFSIGGSYGKTWQDGRYRRYEAIPSEISLADYPQNPDSVITLVKANGVTVELKKGGPGSGEKEGHPFRGNQYTTGRLSGKEEEDARARIESGETEEAIFEDDYEEIISFVNDLDNTELREEYKEALEDGDDRLAAAIEGRAAEIKLDLGSADQAVLQDWDAEDIKSWSDEDLTYEISLAEEELYEMSTDDESWESQKAYVDELHREYNSRSSLGGKDPAEDGWLGWGTEKRGEQPSMFAEILKDDSDAELSSRLNDLYDQDDYDEDTLVQIENEIKRRGYDPEEFADLEFRESSRSLDPREFEEILMNNYYDQGEDPPSFKGSVVTYEEGGYLTQDKGLVYREGNKELQFTVRPTYNVNDVSEDQVQDDLRNFLEGGGWDENLRIRSSGDAGYLSDTPGIEITYPDGSKYVIDIMKR